MPHDAKVGFRHATCCNWAALETETLRNTVAAPQLHRLQRCVRQWDLSDSTAVRVAAACARAACSCIKPVLSLFTLTAAVLAP